MGIFGFLSKAHLEQLNATNESQARVEQIIVEIERQTNVIKRSETKIKQLESTSSVTDTATQDQIDREQERIDNAYTRIQPAINEQNEIISGQTKLYSSQIEKIDANLERLEGYVDSGQIKKAQGLVGTIVDGQWKTKTAAAVKKWTEEQRIERRRLVGKIEQVSQNNTAVSGARAEIKRLRQKVEQQIEDSNLLINRLRDKLASQNEINNIDQLIDQQYVKIKEANLQVEVLTKQQYDIQSEHRKLEAEVGPVKYIAEFVYGDKAGNDANLLSSAVRYVIIILVLVFDPLAVMLILAANSSFKWAKAEEKRKELGYDPEVKENEKLIALEDELVEAKEKYDVLMRTLEERNVEMIEAKETLANAPRGMSDEDLSQIEALGFDLTEIEEKLRVALSEKAKLETVLENTKNQLITQRSGHQETLEEMAAETQQLIDDEREAHKLEIDQLETKIVTTKEIVTVATDSEIQTLITERDRLANELQQSYDDLDIVQKEIARVPLLEQRLNSEHKQVEELTAKISTMSDAQINTDTGPVPKNNLASLRHKIKLLENKIASMVELSSFDIESAQRLIDVTNRNTELERRMTNVVSEYNKLKEIVEKGK